MVAQIALIVFAATLVQGLAGFGLALVSMPLLVGLLGIGTAAPLVAAIGLISVVIVAWHYRDSVSWQMIRPLALGSLLGIPFGVIAIDRINEDIVTLFLGLVIGGYALYVLITPQFALKARAPIGFGFGIVGGLLTGAYNTGGPPLVIYGDGRRWPPATFKANIQILLLIHTVAVIISHAWSGNFTPDVINALPAALAASIAGTLSGVALDRFVSSTKFRVLVLLLLLVLSVRLIVTSLQGLIG